MKLKFLKITYCLIFLLSAFSVIAQESQIETKHTYYLEIAGISQYAAIAYEHGFFPINENSKTFYNFKFGITFSKSDILIFFGSNYLYGAKRRFFESGFTLIINTAEVEKSYFVLSPGFRRQPYVGGFMYKLNYNFYLYPLGNQASTKRFSYFESHFGGAMGFAY